ncbi:hypothetical protein LSTR_LSTR017106 [Laodelphax striatellus]|uniref:Uncharacterized protein n=1 Tax=Laodelphax striatellus TaxID=195883 RepID=A0A482X009_LAOST|nr:hypothetical protein LSTR_LSTR017106 [Laodelphax striatellus]
MDFYVPEDSNCLCLVEARESWKWHVTENERVNEADAPLAGWQEAIYEAQPTPHEQEANRKQGKWSANLE